MAANEVFRRCLSHDAQVYDFCIKFLKITGIRLPVLLKPDFLPVGSSKNDQQYFMKVTLLHGTEQQKIGEFEVVNGECNINHQLSCQILHGRQDVLSKLHVYIGMFWMHPNDYMWSYWKRGIRLVRKCKRQWRSSGILQGKLSILIMKV